MVAKNLPLHPLVKSLMLELDRRKISIPIFSEAWDINKERIYGWKKQGTAPKEDDVNKVKSFLKGEEPPIKDIEKYPYRMDINPLDNYPAEMPGQEKFEVFGELGKVLGNMSERLLRLEARDKAYEPIIALVLEITEPDAKPKKQTLKELRARVTEVSKQHFDESKRKQK